MSHINDLIRRLCPNGVEFKPLGEIGEFVRGNGIQKSDFVETGVGCIHYGQIHTHYGTWATETKSFVSADLASRTRKARTGDLVIATTSEDDAAVGKAVAWLGSDEVAVSTDAYIFRHSLDPRYVSYFFQSDQFSEQKQRHVTGTKVRRIGGQPLSRIRIPVPPAEVQREIVHVLDLFQSLETELETELEARRYQYAHYRDELLTFDAADVRHEALGAMGELFGGLTGKTKADFRGGSSPYVTYMNVFNNLAVDVCPPERVVIRAGERQRSLRKGDVLFTGSSETPDECGMSAVLTVDPPVDLFLNSFCIGYRPHDALWEPNFSKHLFRSAPMRKLIGKCASGVTRFNVSKSRLAKIAVPIPPMAEQRRIASILDNLDALVNDLSAGLPGELAARRTQYEYYRNKLLTFEVAA